MYADLDFTNLRGGSLFFAIVSGRVYFSKLPEVLEADHDYT